MEKIFLNGKKIILIGTAHISEQSINAVREAIEKEKPNVIGVELCKSRFAQLKMGRRWSETNISEIIKTKKTYLFLVNLLLSNIQRRFGQKLGIKPGAEMLEAYNIAKEKNIPIVLLDRDVQITLRRAFSLMSFFEKIKIFFSIISGFFREEEELTPELVERLKQKDMMTELMNELSKTAPTIKKVLVDERDMYISQKISSAKGKKILAVVGAGHIEGIKNYLNKKISLEPLLEIPRKRSFWKFIPYIVPVIFVAILGYAFYSKGILLSLELFALWFLINGILSAAGVVLARGHIFSVLAAFFAAPFTSLHPAIAAGWFAGMVEAKYSKPKIKDFEALNKLNSFADFSKNKVTRILLVTAYANIGSTIGTIIAIPYILSLLG